MPCFVDGIEIGDDGRGGRIAFAGTSPAVLPGALDAADAGIRRRVPPDVERAVAAKRARFSARETNDALPTKPKGRQMRGSLNDVDAYVGRRLRQQRMALGLSQEKLAEAADISFQQVQKYEKGTNRLGASRLAQFAAFLQVSPAWFFDGAPTPEIANRAASGAAASPVDLPGDLLATRDGIRIAQAFLRISDRAVQAKVADLVEATCRVVALAPAQGEALAA